MNWSGIKAVSLDAAGTLLEPWPSVGDVYARVAEECGIGPVSPGELNRRFAALWKNKEGFDYSRKVWRQIVEETFAGLAPLKPAFFDHVYSEFALPRCWRVYEDVGPVLENFRQRGLKLAIISNWDERLRPLLEQLGLAPYFATIVVSSEAGHRKPSPLIFERAAAELGVAAREMVHVGDSRLEDYEGAVGANCAAVLLERDGPREGSIASLTGLLE